MRECKTYVYFNDGKIDIEEHSSIENALYHLNFVLEENGYEKIIGMEIK